MKKRAILLCILFIVSGIYYYNLASNNEKETMQSKLIRVVDGDTIEIENGIKVRLLGINTPEKGQIYYEEAKEYLKQFENESITIETKGVDKYGRILGHVFNEKTHLNEEIMQNGFATLYYYGEDNYYSSLKKAESKAREEEEGIWKKSPRTGCLELLELKYEEDTERCSNEEVVRIKKSLTTPPCSCRNSQSAPCHSEHSEESTSQFDIPPACPEHGRRNPC